MDDQRIQRHPHTHCATTTNTADNINRINPVGCGHRHILGGSGQAGILIDLSLDKGAGV